MTTSRKPRLWFYKPELYWYGWRTLVPFWRGSDEWERSTFVLGWNLFGQVVVAYGRPGFENPFPGSPYYGGK